MGPETMPAVTLTKTCMKGKCKLGEQFLWSLHSLDWVIMYSGLLIKRHCIVREKRLLVLCDHKRKQMWKSQCIIVLKILTYLQTTACLKTTFITGNPYMEVEFIRCFGLSPNSRHLTKTKYVAMLAQTLQLKKWKKKKERGSPLLDPVLALLSLSGGTDPGFARGTMVSAEHKPIMGSRGRTGGQRSWKPFDHFHTKEGPKVKDLSNSSSLCPRKTASPSYD